MNLAQIVLIVYSTLMLVGGIAGYSMAKSVPSLMAGLASTIILDVAFVLTKISGRIGYVIGGWTAFALALFFTYRVIHTGKFMPAGCLLALSVIAGILIMRGTAPAKN